MPRDPLLLVTHLTRRFQRRALQRRNLTYWLWRFVANGTRTYRALTDRGRYSDTTECARELREHGIVIGPSTRFLSDSGQGALVTVAARVLEASRSEAVQTILSGTAATARKKDFRVDLVSYPKGLPTNDPLLKLALDTKLLEVVSSYLGMWPRLHAVGAWLNYPTDAPPSTSQLWHSDPEDLRIIKVFIYVSDVDEHSGPFTYLPGTHPFGHSARRAAQCKKRSSDEDMNRVFPKSAWRVCTGPANTMILADTLGFHRGGKPTVGQRLLVTFTYTSATPLVSRQIRVAGTPPWLTADIQRLALR